MRIKEASTNIIYIRHGQTDFPLDRVYCDSSEDPALNENGIKQASFAAHFLSRQDISAIYVSPAKRTMDTANIIAGNIVAPIIETSELRERSLGIWDGLYFHEIEKKFPNEYALWKQDKSGFTPDNGESINDLCLRLEIFTKEILTLYRGRTIIVVSHVGPIRSLVSKALQMPIQQYRQLRIDYGACTKVDYGESQNNLIYFNIYKGLFD